MIHRGHVECSVDYLSASVRTRTTRGFGSMLPSQNLIDQVSKLLSTVIIVTLKPLGDREYLSGELTTHLRDVIVGLFMSLDNELALSVRPSTNYTHNSDNRGNTPVTAQMAHCDLGVRSGDNTTISGGGATLTPVRRLVIKQSPTSKSVTNSTPTFWISGKPAFPTKTHNGRVSPQRSPKGGYLSLRTLNYGLSHLFVSGPPIQNTEVTNTHSRPGFYVPPSYLLDHPTPRTHSITSVVNSDTICEQSAQRVHLGLGASTDVSAAECEDGLLICSVLYYMRILSDVELLKTVMDHSCAVIEGEHMSRQLPGIVWSRIFVYLFLVCVTLIFDIYAHDQSKETMVAARCHRRDAICSLDVMKRVYAHHRARMRNMWVTHTHFRNDLFGITWRHIVESEVDTHESVRGRYQTIVTRYLHTTPRSCPR